MSDLSMSMFATKADYWKARAEAAEAELRENEGVIRAWRRRTEEAEAEVERFRQGLWDCFREAGGDTDGEETPHARKSDLVPLAVDCVRDLRECYAEAQAECSAAEADARRYRWLRDFALLEPDDQRVWEFVEREFDDAADIDSAIDAELAKEPKP